MNKETVLIFYKLIANEKSFQLRDLLNSGGKLKEEEYAHLPTLIPILEIKNVDAKVMDYFMFNGSNLIQHAVDQKLESGELIPLSSIDIASLEDFEFLMFENYKDELMKVGVSKENYLEKVNCISLLF